MPKRQEAVVQAASRKCATHPSHDLAFVCLDDNQEFVCTTCVSSTHSGHHLVDIGEFSFHKRQSVNSFVMEAEAEMPRLEHRVSTVDRKIAGNETFFRDLISDIEKQGSLLKAEIDRITANYVTICNELQVENDEKLKQHKIELQQTMDNMSSLLKTCKEVMTRDNDYEIIETERKIPEERSGPPDFPLKAAVFREGASTAEQKIRVFGSLSIEGDISDKSNESVKTDVAALEMLNEFQFNKEPHRICPSTDEQAWILEHHSDEVALFSRDGNVIRTLKVDIRLNDISVSPVTRNLWMACVDKKIREVRTSTIPVVKFKVDTVPQALCVTQEDHVVVGMLRKVAIFNAMGYVQKVMDKFSSLARMLKHPSHIAECSTTRELLIVVSDKTGKQKVHVSIVDKDLKLKYHHNGDSISFRNGTIKPSGYTVTQPFLPGDSCFDSNMNMLMVDRGNQTIASVKTRGKKIITQVMMSDDRKPNCVAVQDSALLWVGFSEGTIRVYKYIM